MGHSSGQLPSLARLAILNFYYDESPILLSLLAFSHQYNQPLGALELELVLALADLFR